ncbi:MAG: tRNA lysidine(34) synthetase TilS [Vicinamibacteria bacterium]|nr:tRNA lysidine(34) synthetase TilS [Vicinamibacteria bacterium]
MPTPPLVSAVRRSLDSVGLLRPGVVVLAALSGGPDSVALLDALLRAARKAGLAVVAAHLDHALRRDSLADAQFCEELCDNLKVRLRSGRMSPSAKALHEGGVEEAARLTRYSFLRRVAREENASAIVLGHTLDDQAETVLMRLVRGSGALGLSAMKAWDGELLRPLLDTRRDAVLAHLNASRLPYRSDPTNTDTTFIRNRVRHELLPLIEKRFNPNIAEALGRTARTLAEEHAALREVAAQLLDRAVASAVEGAAYEVKVLKSAPEGLGKTALREALRRFGGLRSVSFVHVEGLFGLVHDGRGGATLPLPGSRLATISRGRLILTAKDQTRPGHSREKPFLS